MTNLVQYQTFVHADLEPPTPTGVQIKENLDTVSISTIDGVTTETRKGTESGRVSDNNPHAGTESILATAVHPRGLPVHAIEDSTLVTVNGLQAPASFWVKEGLLTKAADGTITEATAVPQEVSDEASSDDIRPIHPENMAEIHAALQGVEESSVQGILAIGVGVATGRLDMAALEAKWAQVTGQGGEDSNLGRMQEILQHQADHAVVTHGVASEDLGQFYAWAQTHSRDQLADAIGKQLHFADTSGYRALVTKFLATVPPSAEALKKAGIPVRRSSHRVGAVEVFIPGAGNGWMSPEAAARAGLI